MFRTTQSTNYNTDNQGFYHKNNSDSIIPYYATEVKMNGNIDFNVLGWTLNISQTITPKTFAKRTANKIQNQGLTPTAPLPSKLAFGMLAADISITHFLSNQLNFNLSGVKPHIDFETDYNLTKRQQLIVSYYNLTTECPIVKLSMLQLQSASPTIFSAGQASKLQLSYIAHAINI